MFVLCSIPSVTSPPPPHEFRFESSERERQFWRRPPPLQHRTRWRARECTRGARRAGAGAGAGFSISKNKTGPDLTLPPFPTPPPPPPTCSGGLETPPSWPAAAGSRRVLGCCCVCVRAGDRQTAMNALRLRTLNRTRTDAGDRRFCLLFFRSIRKGMEDCPCQRVRLSPGTGFLEPEQ